MEIQKCFKSLVILIFCLLIISLTDLFGQTDFRNGYIITLDNDTIYGEINYRSNNLNYKSCQLRIDDRIDEFSPLQIKGYGFFQDKFYTSDVLEKSFVEVLVEGELSLYKYDDYYFVRKPNDRLFKLEQGQEEIEVDNHLIVKDDNKWKGLLNYLISDCEKNQSKDIKYLKYSEKNITELVINYNKCRDSKYLVFKKNLPWTKIEYGILAALSPSTITFIDSDRKIYLSNKYKDTYPSFGALLGISSPRLSDKYAFNAELHFSKSNYSSLVVHDGAAITEYYDSFIDLTKISIPLSIKYIIPKPEYSFFIQGGINFDFVLDENTWVISEFVYKASKTVNTREFTGIETGNFQRGLWIGVGMSKSFEVIQPGISIRFYHLGSQSRNEGFDAYHNRISFMIIISR